MFGKRPTGNSTSVDERSAPAAAPRALSPAPAAGPPPAGPAGEVGGRTPFPSAGLGAPLIGAPTPGKSVNAGPKAPPAQVPSAAPR